MGAIFNFFEIKNSMFSSNNFIIYFFQGAMYQCGLILTYAPDELASGEESGNFSNSKKKVRCRLLNFY